MALGRWSTADSGWPGTFSGPWSPFRITWTGSERSARALAVSQAMKSELKSAPYLSIRVRGGSASRSSIVE